jgi:ArsR family transcriptional regulator
MNISALQICKALSDDNRLKIISILEKGGEISCSDISTHFTKVSQPTLSHHFKVLSEAKIINVRKEGVSCFYSLNSKYLETCGVEISKLLKI